MHWFTTVGYELVEPRGRCNRKGLLVLALVMLALEVAGGLALYVTGSAIDGPVAIMAKAAVMWMAIAAGGKRLHDLGRSAWWMAAGIAAVAVWAFALAIGMAFLLGPDFLLRSPIAFSAVFAGTMAPAMAALVWLHFAKGEVAANRFGPVPHGPGFGRWPEISCEPVTKVTSGETSGMDGLAVSR